MSGASWPVRCSPNQVTVMRFQERGFVANIPLLLRASGKLDRETLREALQLIVDRHDILRSTFSLTGTRLFMSAPAACEVALKARNVSRTDNPIAAANRESAVECQTPFALDALPRLRLKLYRLAADDHLIALIIDHLASDGVALGVLAAEWRAFYQALEAGTPIPIAPSPPQYTTFIRSLSAWLRSEEADRDRSWWATYLSGYREALAAPPVGAVRKAVAVDFALGAEAGRRVATLCTRYRLTPFMVLLAAYALVLCGFTNERDLLITTARANRRDPQSRAMIGHLAGAIPLRMALGDIQHGDGLLRMIGTHCRSAYEHDRLPFRDIAAIASHEAGIAPASLGRYTINLIPFPSSADLWSPDLRVSLQWGVIDPEPLTTAQVSFFIRQDGMRSTGTLLVDPATVNLGWAAAFESRITEILFRFAESPRTPLDQLISAASRA